MTDFIDLTGDGSDDHSGEEDEFESYCTSIAPPSKKGTGYGGSRCGGIPEDISWLDKAAVEQKRKDEKLLALLKAVRVFLPDHDREGGALTSDFMASNLILRSFLFQPLTDISSHSLILGQSLIFVDDSVTLQRLSCRTTLWRIRVIERECISSSSSGF
jgi:hypothetical protein